MGVKFGDVGGKLGCDEGTLWGAKEEMWWGGSEI